MMQRTDSNTHRLSRTRRAFTLMEMLVVIAIMITLLAVLIVGLNSAVGGAQEANTRTLMQSIRQALVTFEKDIGYLPPILDENRDLIPSPVPPLDPDNPSLVDRLTIQNWMSETSLAEFLIGYGDRMQDGYGDESLNEWPPAGIRHPDFDGVWRATLDGGLLTDRDPVPPEQGGLAESFGPYFELADESLLGSTQGERDASGQLIVYLPGENGFSLDDPRVIVDYWGNPIQYFRSYYAQGRPNQEYRPVDRNGDGIPEAPPTLAEVWRLRPQSVDPGSGIDGWGDISGDTLTSRELKSARFALFSPGRDRKYDWRVRRSPLDAEEPNLDNIVEVGP